MGETRDLVERNLKSWSDHDLKTWTDDSTITRSCRGLAE
jgi:hypothetical protein